ncbi:MAG: N-acetylglucosamine-6-phosphate deacetylase [Verrucomicrobiae bacterium]|nr:N-acetylglucosamine-6-phosphate deacetylase [Verrucomicrobiae bacterium]
MSTPPFFDLQVNGYGGVDFNQDDLTAEQFHHACERLLADGVAGILATIITEEVPRMCHRLRRIVELRAADPLAQRVVAGLHVEGPFLNPEPGYRGAHPVDAIQPASLNVAKRLVEAGQGLVRLVTLAPEQDAGGVVTRWLAGQDIVVSAGHTNASREQLQQALDAGLTMFTHLGNGCPMQLPRHDNIIQRVLSLADRFWICFIADGIHVPFFALGNYLKVTGLARVVITTDAMAAAGLGPGRYTVGRWDVRVGEDMAARSPDGSHLIGSAITMQRSFSNLQTQLGLTEAEAQLLVSDNPRRALRLETAR